jgi:Uma2 family endonuclease
MDFLHRFGADPLRSYDAVRQGRVRLRAATGRAIFRFMAKAQIVEPCQRMTRAEYRAWAERQPSGRFERIDGVIVAMAPEREEHNRRKMLAWLVLRRAVHDAGLPCDVCGDGMTVEVGDSDYEPDAVLYCGDRLPPGSVAVPNPLVIVEVLSPNSSATDRAWKLREYFWLPSVRHYLIVWADRQQVVHHRRDEGGAIATTMLTSGEIGLEPPGIAIAVEEIYQD